MDHFPVKLLPRVSQDFMTWGCEGCTQIFKTKNEFWKHVVVELKKMLSDDSTSQDDKSDITARITRLRRWASDPSLNYYLGDVLALCDEYETLSSKREQLIKETRKLVDAASLWSRVDDHTYCHDDTPGGCVVINLRNVLDSVEDLLLAE